MGCGEKWIEWSISVLNKKVCGPSFWFISNLLGVALSFLFVIVIKVFSLSFEKSEDRTLPSKLACEGRGAEGIIISHLLFFYGTLVFFGASIDQMTYLS